MNEHLWERARLNQVRRERMALWRKGFLKFVSYPIVMVKDSEGNWKLPALVARSEESV